MGQSTLPPCPANPSLGKLLSSKDNCFGSYDWPDGAKYVGEWRSGKYHGWGTLTLKSGRKYVGEYRDGARNGVGSLEQPDGSKYVGEWRNNLRHGQGIEYKSVGEVLSSGTFHDDKLIYSRAVDANQFPYHFSALTIVQQQVSSSDLNRSERDRLAGEVEAERKRRQELEQQLATAQSQGGSRPQGSVQPATPALRAHALVIGNAAYPGSSRLQNPVNDAQGVSEKLRSMGFVVTTVTDANRSRLLQALSQFSRSAAISDVSVLYYSGHGVQIDGTNYMLPTDIDNADALQATLQGVSLNTVVENFLPGKARLVFLDACRDNPLRVAGTRTIAKGLAPISVAQGTLIAYSTRDGQVALDGLGGRYSPFTQALIEHLSDPSDIGVVLRKVREKVMQRTNGRQQPWEYGSLTGGELVLSAIKGSK
jgi:hypothetical protein